MSDEEGSPVVRRQEAQEGEDVPGPKPPPSRPTLMERKKGGSDAAAYGKTVGGALKIKGVDFKKKRKGAAPDPVGKPTPTELLNERAKKKSDRYCQVNTNF